MRGQTTLFLDTGWCVEHVLFERVWLLVREMVISLQRNLEVKKFESTSLKVLLTSSLELLWTLNRYNTEWRLWYTAWIDWRSGAALSKASDGLDLTLVLTQKISPIVVRDVAAGSFSFELWNLRANVVSGRFVVCSFFVPEPVAFRRVYGTWDLLVYHVTIAAPYPGGIDPRLAVHARSWDGHHTTRERSCIFVGTGRPLLLILRFCGLIFGIAKRRSQKWDRENAFLLFFWAVHAVPKLGPPGGPIFETVFRFIFVKFLASGLKKRNVLVSTETLWLMATGKATREALLSEAGFEKVFRTQNWVRRSKLFCRWFCSLLGQAGCISVAAWTRWKLASYYLVSSGGLIVCC